MANNETCGICTYDFNKVPCIIVERKIPIKTTERLVKRFIRIITFLFDFLIMQPKDKDIDVTKEEILAEQRRKVY